MSVNKVQLIGHLGQDPDVKYTQTGQAVCTISLATTENWKDKNSGAPQSSTEWHRIVVWGKQAELCKQYLVKGSQIFVEGKITTRSWEDKDKNKRYTTEILAKEIKFLGRAETNQENHAHPKGGSQGSSSNSNQSADKNYANDDIPF